MRRWVGWGLGTCFVASASCSLLTDLSALSGDASVDAPIEAPNDGFILTTKPGHVTLDPTESFDVEIDITRGGSFQEIVDVTVQDVGGLSGVDMTPQPLTFTASDPTKLHLFAQQAAPTHDATVKLVGISRLTQKSQTTTFGVRIGSKLVDTQTSMTQPIPSYASSVWIKAWGAGGGAGGSQIIYSANNTLAVGGFGGGGGMSGGIFATPSGSTLDIKVGTPGATSGGGSGGGFTSVSLGTSLLLVAGGGGGGGQGHSDATYCNSVLGGGNGLAGGGANGQASSRSATLTSGGAAGDSNATAGTPSQGGNGSLPATNNCKYGCADGGVPGGGRAGTSGQCEKGGGGGGGGGQWGGGGGGITQGGGGGSGFVSDAGADVIQAVGNGSSPAATGDPDYKAGSATGGAANTDTSSAVAATPGHVIVYLPKP